MTNIIFTKNAVKTHQNNTKNAKYKNLILKEMAKYRCLDHFLYVFYKITKNAVKTYQNYTKNAMETISFSYKLIQTKIIS